MKSLQALSNYQSNKQQITNQLSSRSFYLNHGPSPLWMYVPIRQWDCQKRSVWLLVCWQNLLCKLDSGVHPQSEQCMGLPWGSLRPLSPGQQIPCRPPGLGAKDILSACLPRQTQEQDKQMRGVSCVAVCIWMCRFNHLTGDWDLWGEHLCGGAGEKGNSSTLTKSLSSVTFISVSFISVCVCATILLPPTF